MLGYVLDRLFSFLDTFLDKISCTVLPLFSERSGNRITTIIISSVQILGNPMCRMESGRIQVRVRWSEHLRSVADQEILYNGGIFYSQS